MNIQNITNILTIIQTQLWTNVQSYLLVVLVISGLSSIVVEGIKNADENVFRKKQASNMGMWFINLALTWFLSLCFLIIIKLEGTILHQVAYLLIIGISSWAMSIPVYYTLKFFKQAYIILSLKLNNFIETEKLDYILLRNKRQELEKKSVLNKVLDDVERTR